MKRGVIVASVFLLIMTNISLACWFDTGWITYIQPNGVKFTARMWGDEYESFFETKEGFSIERNYKDNYYYYAGSSDKGRFILTQLKVGIDKPVGIPKNLVKISPYLTRPSKSKNNYSPNENIRLAKTTTTTYTLKVLLVEFNDILGRDYTRAQFENMLDGSNYTTISPNSETVYGSMNQYYNSMTNGDVIINATVLNSSSGNDIPNWVRLSYNKNDYKNNTRNFFTDAYNAGVAAGYDLSTNSTTKLVYIYAGNFYSGGLNPTAEYVGSSHYMNSEVWGGRTHYDNENTAANGYTFAHIGIHCHEFGHVLGLWDIYGYGHGVDWSLMGDGCDMGNTTPMKAQCPAPIDPHHRYLHNWISVQTPSIPNNGVNLTYDGSNPTIYRIVTGDQYYTEVFYFENRRYQDYGRFCPDYGSYAGSGGIIVWHTNGETFNPRIEILEADGEETFKGNYGDLWPGISGNRTLNDFTAVNCKKINGTNSSIIMHSVSNPGTTMTAVLGGKWFGTLPSSLIFSGTVLVGGNLTIPSGLTLTVSSGTSLLFDCGSSLIINNYGTLTANGILTSPITFNFNSPNSATQNGIVFNSGSSGTINYCKIRNAYRGIYENSVSINITNSAISGCTDGIYLYCSSPVIQDCNIHDNSNYGINMINSSPVIKENYIQNNDAGIYCSTNSQPVIGNNSPQIGNHFSNNNYGVIVFNNSLPKVGDGTYGGYNNFVNPNNNILNSTANTVYARNNWWGTTNPAYFKITGPVSYTPYRTSVVNIDMPPLSKTGGEVYASENSEIPMLSELDKAYELVASGNLTEARQVCLNLINSYPDYSVSFNALNLLKETYMDNELTSKKNVYKSIFDAKSKRDLYAMAGLILSDIDKENKLKQIDEVIENYKGESVIELALFDKFVYYYFELNDVKNARSISNELDKQFPESMGAIEAHKILGDEEYFKSDIIINKDKIQESNPEEEIPNSFSLDGNYPNPFNPTTEIKFSVPVISNVKLTIYNIMGQEIKTFESDGVSVGTHSFNWNGRNKNEEQVSSGIYIYRLRAIGSNGEVFEKSAKMILLR